MRFLLYPTKKAALSQSIKSNRQKNNDVVAALLSPPAAERATQNSTSYTPPMENKATATTSKTVWGQQCNVNCGCVVRFQATIDIPTLQVTSVEYQAKTVLTTTTNNNNNINSNNNDNERIVLTTSKGRPMLKECTCKTLHVLSSAIVNYMIDSSRGCSSTSTGSNNSTNQRRDWNQLYGLMCDFEQTRSSEAFRDAVLHAQNLPSSDAHCFDVVEEAITAMIKGYLPQPRRKYQHQHPNHYNNNNAQRQVQQQNQHHPNYYYKENDVDEYDEQYYYYDSENNNNRNQKNPRYHFSTNLWYHPSRNHTTTNDNEDVDNASTLRTQLPFGNLFTGRYNEELEKDEANNNYDTTASALTTITMYDIALAKHRELDDEQQQVARKNQSMAQQRKQQQQQSMLIQDWVSFVDHQYYNSSSSLPDDNCSNNEELSPAY